MGEFRSSRNSTSSRIKNQLETITIKLSARQVEKQKVAEVDLAMNKRRGNGLHSSLVKSISDSAKIWNG